MTKSDEISREHCLTAQKEARQYRAQARAEERERLAAIRQANIEANCSPNEPRDLCMTCYNLQHRRAKPVCPKCGEPWEALEPMTVEEIMERTVDHE